MESGTLFYIWDTVLHPSGSCLWSVLEDIWDRRREDKAATSGYQTVPDRSDKSSDLWDLWLPKLLLPWFRHTLSQLQHISLSLNQFRLTGWWKIMTLSTYVLCKMYILVTTIYNTIGEWFTRLIYYKNIYNLYKKVRNANRPRISIRLREILVTAGGVADPVNISSNISLVTMQNLVTVSYTVCEKCKRSQEVFGTLVHRPIWLGEWL